MNRSLQALPCVLCCVLMAISYAGIAQGNFAFSAKYKLNQQANLHEDQKADTSIEANRNEPMLKQYSRYNFIPGEQLIYTEDFSQDAIGDLPLDWNSSGKAEVVTLEGMPGKWLKLFQNSNYLSANKAAFPKNFTYEFDIIPQLKNTGYTFPLFNFGILSSSDLSTTDNVLLDMPYKFQSADILIRPATNNASYSTLKTDVNRANHFQGGDQKIADFENYYYKVAHIAIQVKGSRMEIWINSEKVYDIPKALADTYTFNQLYFKVGSSGYKDHEAAFFISNLKVATGQPDTRQKLITEGKFTTTAILFDVNTAIIKPESFGIIKEIATVLKENASVNITITGHTDSDGADAANQALSQKRANAVKEILANEYAIDASRIETAGKGETAPLSDNSTKEGKAQNRRVEFTRRS